MATGKTQSNKDALLADLTGRLQSAFAGRLVSVILFGSGAAGDAPDTASDLNVLCVLNRITTEELAKSEPVFQWWRERGNPTPLMLAADEVGTSTDCFPMEYHDMKEFRRVLYGADVIDGLEVRNSFYRAQVEHELRAKQIRLRQKSAALLTDPTRLLQLLVQSISTFCVLGRHALILSGNQPHWKKLEIVSALEEAMGTGLAAFRGILAVRHGGKLAPGQSPLNLLEGYLADTASLVQFVDRLAE